MNGWQVVQQMQYLLRVLRWQDGGQEAVFDPGSVLVTGGAVRDSLEGVIRPLAMIFPGSRQNDPEYDGLGEESFGVRLVHWDGDSRGELVLVGGNRKSSGQGSSEGRGLLEYETEVLRAIEHLGDFVGVRVAGGFRSAPEVAYDPELDYTASRVLTIAAETTRERYYHAPQRLVATALGGGSVSLAWALPAARFDFHDTVTTPSIAARGRVVLRRASGSTPPASATAGTGVTLSGDFATSVTDTPGAGTHSYALFVGYDETGSGSPERYSDAEVGSYRAGVVVT